MNWKLLALIPPIMIGLFILVSLWGVKQMLSVNNKFMAFVCGAIAVVLGILLYAIYGHYIFG